MCWTHQISGGGDVAAFEKFALQVQSLVGMMRTLGSEGEAELQCGSHVARLLSKLPPEQRAEFRRGTQTHTLPDLSEWLRYESWCQGSEGQLAVRGARRGQCPDRMVARVIAPPPCSGRCTRSHQAAQCNLKKPCSL